MISYSVISHYYMKVLAIIPARGGSKRIPNKNIRDFCGKPLIAYAIEQAKASPFVNRVIVDTDSNEIADIAKPASSCNRFRASCGFHSASFRTAPKRRIV
ncbi:MAG: Acylneuraminate cytidylyltransferase [Parcubacteria group bacterium GW2011_GWF2_50_9]|nr:MAG: Acylneuraminate cytidylyltransferase [Parcubacteria group bacterium GW2011_GWF2_50_9]